MELPSPQNLQTYQPSRRTFPDYPEPARNVPEPCRDHWLKPLSDFHMNGWTDEHYSSDFWKTHKNIYISESIRKFLHNLRNFEIWTAFEVGASCSLTTTTALPLALKAPQLFAQLRRSFSSWSQLMVFLASTFKGLPPRCCQVTVKISRPNSTSKPSPRPFLKHKHNTPPKKAFSTIQLP